MRLRKRKEEKIRRNEEKTLRQQGDIDALINEYQGHLALIDKNLSSYEKLSDASQKIVELAGLRDFITSMSDHFQSDLEKIAERHVREDAKSNESVYVYLSQKDSKEKQLREKNPGIAAVEEALSGKSAPVNKLLDETTRSCYGKLAEVASSPFYPQAWKEHEPLRNLFAAAKAAREALGDQAPAAVQTKKLRL